MMLHGVNVAEPIPLVLITASLGAASHGTTRTKVEIPFALLFELAVGGRDRLLATQALAHGKARREGENGGSHQEPLRHLPATFAQLLFRAGHDPLPSFSALPLRPLGSLARAGSVHELGPL